MQGRGWQLITKLLAKKFHIKLVNMSKLMSLGQCGAVSPVNSINTGTITPGKIPMFG